MPTRSLFGKVIIFNKHSKVLVTDMKTGKQEFRGLVGDEHGGLFQILGQSVEQWRYDDQKDRFYIRLKAYRLTNDRKMALTDKAYEFAIVYEFAATDKGNDSRPQAEEDAPHCPADTNFHFV